MNLYEKTTIISLLQKYNLWTQKRFGQNFLINKDILQKIVDTADLKKNDYVIEVGPGLGVLTKELAQKSKKVLSIELDRNLLPILKETLFEFENIEIINEDALKFSPSLKKYKVVANIPYNITSHLINHFLRAKNPPTTITLLVQKEVAEKIRTLEPDMSVLSLQVALFGHATVVKKISAFCFFPAPKVDSAIIHIKLYDKNSPNYIPKDEALQILNLAKKAFSQKRKKLRNTIGNDIKNSPIDLNRRPETLSVDEWKTLSKSLKI